MKVIVLGLWHLGSVTAACLAEKNHKVYAIDDDVQLLKNLKKGISRKTTNDKESSMLKGTFRVLRGIQGV